MEGGTFAVVDELWSPVCALTAAHEGRANGLITTTALAASLLPEAPRVLVQLAPWHLTAELVVASSAFAVHLLPAEPEEALRRSLALVERLGFRSGRHADKLAGLDHRPGVTGSPLLADALGYVEARVAGLVDLEDFTLVLADVVAGERRPGRVLTPRLLAEHAPPGWGADWAERLELDRAEARRRRGL